VTPTLTAPGPFTGAVVGQYVTVGSERYRVRRLDSPTSMVLGRLHWHERLWLFLTTTPNGDATRWMDDPLPAR
jgi:hypothetical protein